VFCSNFVKFGRREIGEIMHYLPDKKNKKSPGSQALATARIAPKICQGQSPTMFSERSRFHPNRFTFGGGIPERVNTIKTRRKVFSTFGWSVASSRIINVEKSMSSVIHRAGPGTFWARCITAMHDVTH